MTNDDLLAPACGNAEMWQRRSIREMNPKKLILRESLRNAAPGERIIANCVPNEAALPRPRPKVGETLDKPFHIPDSAFAPLTDEELEEWGL